MKQNKTILYCILDWGLGHATRSMPILRHLVDKGHHVIVASSPQINQFVKQQLPSLSTQNLPSYEPYYSTRNLMQGLLFDLSRFWKVYKEERVMMKRIELELQPDLIISDNRFGCYSKNVKSIYLSHQMQFRLKGPYALLNAVPEQIHRLVYRKYQHVLIVDSEKLRLAGALSERVDRGEYLGLLSAVERKEGNVTPGKIVVLLSGPEPHRTKLELLILKELSQSDYQIVLFRGSDKDMIQDVPSKWKRYNRGDSVQLSNELCDAELVICRSGYSSLMDLVHLQKKALVIPTKGQAEQEYLAAHVASKGWFQTVEECDFTQNTVCTALNSSSFPPKNVNFSSFKKVIDRLV